MRALRIASSLAAALVALLARAETREYTGVHRQFTSDQVLSILGKPHDPPRHTEIDFNLGFEGDFQVNQNCGKVWTEFSIGALNSKIRHTTDKLKSDIGSSAEAAISALPMMITCYMSPSICAEIKNVNLQIREHLREMADVCRAMDSYIDERAAEGKAAKARGWEACVNAKEQGGYKAADAQEECNDSNPKRLYTDIAQSKLKDVTTDKAQNVLEAMMDASKQLGDSMGQSRYRFLAAVLGEIRIEENGKPYPLFPGRKSLTATAVAEKIDRLTNKWVCDQTRFATAVKGTGEEPLTSITGDVEERFYEDILLTEVKHRVSATDLQNLAALDPAEQKLACNAISRGLGRDVLFVTAQEGKASAEKAFQNEAVPPEILQAFQERASAAFRTMHDKAASDPVTPTREILASIGRMAVLRNRLRASTAASISQEDIGSDQAARGKCDSSYTCGNGR